ncbi:MAG: hypothetical protein AABY84_03480 [Candidatus Firestonebacteria bacterium]
MSKKAGIVNMVGGAISSVAGLLGATCVVCAPVCGGAILAGPFAFLLGAGTVAFLHKHSKIFVAVGILWFFLGLFLIFRQMARKKLSGCQCSGSEETKKQ